MTNGNGDWREWSKFVLKAIEKLEVKVDTLENSLHESELEIQKELVQLKTKASMAGGIIGLITSVIVSVISGVIVFWMTKANQVKQTDTLPRPTYHYNQQAPSQTPPPGVHQNTGSQPAPQKK